MTYSAAAAAGAGGIVFLLIRESEIDAVVTRLLFVIRPVQRVRLGGAAVNNCVSRSDIFRAVRSTVSRVSVSE